MKPIHLFLTIIFFLTSCAPATTILPTTTVESSATSMPTSTIVIASETPKPSPTATEAIDPIAGPRPTPEANANTMYVDSTRGQWAEQVGNEIHYYSQEAGVWTVPHLVGDFRNGGAPFINVPSINFKSLPIYIDYVVGLQGPTFTGSSLSTASGTGLDFTRYFESQLVKLYKENKSNPPLSSDVTIDQWLTSGFAVPFKTPDNTYAWNVNTKTALKFIGIYWDNADPSTHPGFWETQYDNQTFRWKIITDTKGDVIAIAAVKDPTTLTNIQALEWVLNPLAVMLVSPNQQIDSTAAKWWYLATDPSQIVYNAMRSPDPDTPPFLSVNQSQTILLTPTSTP